MQKIVLAVLVVALLGVLGLGFWWVGRTSDEPGQAGPAEAAVVAAPAAAPAELTPPEQDPAALPSAPVAEATRADEPTAVAATGDERLDASRTLWVEGSVTLPVDTPPDERIEILAFVQAAPGHSILDDLDEEPANLVDRIELDERGGFRLGFPEGTSQGWLLLDGRYAYVSEALQVTVPGDEPASIQPELGAWVTGRLLPPDDATADELEGLGEKIALRPDPIRSIGFNGISDGGPRTRRTKAREDLTYELGGVAEGEGWRLRAVPERLAAFKGDPFSLRPGQHLVLDLRLTRGATVTGRVVDGEGAPVAEADVGAVQDPLMFGQGGFEVRATETGEDGTFELIAVAPGVTSIEVEADGFLKTSENLQLAEGERIAGLELALDAGGQLAGIVLWQDRTPVVGVDVEVRFDASYLGGMEAFNAMRGARGDGETDEDGRFLVSGLGKGPFTVEVEAEREEAGDRESTWKVRLSDVRPGGDDLELILSPPIGVTGRVVDDLGDPAVAFKVLAREKGGQGLMAGLGAETHSDDFENEAGEFFLDGLSAGAWELFAYGEGYGRPEALDVTLPLADGEVVELVVERAAVVVGRVVDPFGAGVSGATVGLKQTLADIGRLTMDEQPAPEATCDESGAFVLEGLATGNLQLVARAEGFASSEPVSVELAPAETVEEVLIELRVGGRLTGVVYDSAGKPDAGQSVLAQIPTDPLSQSWANTDGQGRFEIENMNPGTWQVMTFPSGSQDAQTGDDVDMNDFGALFADMKFTMAEIRDGEETHVELGAPPKDPVDVHGRIVADGAPVDGALITFFADGGEGISMKFTTSNTKGEFEMQLAGPGRYTVSVQKMLGTGQQQSIEYSRDIPEGPEHDLVLDLPVAGISGRVVGPDGAPRGGTRITLMVDGPIRNGSFTGGNYAEVVTEPDGTYELLWLRPGTYSVAAGGSFLGGFFGDTGGETFGRQVQNGLRVSEGEWLRKVDFKLRQPGRIVGKVLDSTKLTGVYSQ